MNTEQLYIDVYQNPWPEEYRRFAMAMIKADDIPDDCSHCTFKIFKPESYCQLVEKYIISNFDTQCVVYDFTKYLMEYI